jgi:hypothetical protein
LPGDAGNAGAKLLHHTAAADHGRRGRAAGGGERLLLILEPCLHECPRHEGLELLGREGLFHVVERAASHGLDGGRDRGVGGDHQDLRAIVPLAQALDEIEPREPRHL